MEARGEFTIATFLLLVATGFGLPPLMATPKSVAGVAIFFGGVVV